MINKTVKKYFYITMFVFLGVLASFVVHAGVEMAVIDLLVNDFERYNLGLSWNGWLTVHAVGSVLLLAIYAMTGLWLGKHFWEKKYE